MDATDLDDPDQMCPYDPAHSVKRSRMQYHLVRCRKNHKSNLGPMETCPFNVTHIIPEQEYRYHVDNCPESGVVINFIQTKEPVRDLGVVSMEEIKNSDSKIPKCEEDWDNDPSEKTYDAVKEAKNRGVSIAEVGLSKAKKRQNRYFERERVRNLEDEGVNFNPAPRNYRPRKSEVKDDLATPLRAPRTKPMTASIGSN